MNNSSKVEFRDPQKLRLHPLLQRQPGMAEDSEEFGALMEDIRVRGIDQPIVIDPDERIMDGRHRWRAVKKLQIPTVPVFVKPAGTAVDLMLQSILQRRHYTLGARTFMGVSLLCQSSILEPTEPKPQQKGLAHPVRNPFLEETSEEALAAKWGVSRRLLVQAKALEKMLEEHPDWRSECEEALYVEGHGLGAVLAGMASRLATQGHQRAKTTQLELFEDAWRVLGRRLSYWDGLEVQDRNAMAPVIRLVVNEMSKELRDELRKALKAAERQEGE